MKKVWIFANSEESSDMKSNSMSYVTNYICGKSEIVFQLALVNLKWHNLKVIFPFIPF